jgi:pimeloyl-ACP methyl ester carboxylesterase
MGNCGNCGTAEVSLAGLGVNLSRRLGGRLWPSSRRESFRDEGRNGSGLVDADALAPGARSAARTLPIVVGEDPPLLGLLTVPEGRHGERGVVLCAPLFHQNICSYRPVRNLAMRIADAGQPVLRFDWPNCGDSGDVPVVSMSTLTDSIRDAIHALREQTGVEKVTLVGVRIGATLATLAARDEPDVDELVLLAPFATGHAYLRELRAFEAMVQDQFSEPNFPVPPIPDGSLEAGGFLISPAEMEAFEGIDLVSAASSVSAKRVLVAVAQPTRDVAAFVDALRTVNRTALTAAVVPELTHVWAGTLFSHLPRACSELVCSWLTSPRDES